MKKSSNVDLLITTVINDILNNHIKTEMMKAWLTQHNQEIEEKITRSIKQKESQNAERVSKEFYKTYAQHLENYQQQLKSYKAQKAQLKKNNLTSIKPIEPQKPIMVTKYDHEYPQSQHNEVELSSVEKESIKQEHLITYQDNFINTRWNNDFKQQLEAQIEKFNLIFILNCFLNTHRWLMAELINPNRTEKNLLYCFLYDLLSNQLVSLLISDKINAWHELSKNQLVKEALVWKEEAINQEWLLDYIKGYPLSDIRTCLKSFDKGVYYCQ